MRTEILLLALLLCSSSVISEFTNKTDLINGNIVLNTSGELQAFNGNGTKKTSFMELNDDVLYIITTKLDLTSLSNIAGTTRRLASLAATVFHQKYRNYQFTIINVQENKPVKFLDQTYTKHLDIHDFKLSLHLLKYFSNSIQMLSIDNIEIEEHHSAIINRYANNYGAASIKHLNVQWIKRNTLEQFTVPFQEVTDFTCFFNVKEMNTNVLPFDKLFPKLAKLSLMLNSNLDYGFIDCQLPNLTHLDIAASEESWKQSQPIEGLIEKNTQIRSLAVKWFPLDFVKTINRLMPNLESLKLHGFMLNQNVHFDHVKDFTLTISSPASIDKLSFSRLESLDIKYSPNLIAKWVTFFRQHRNLTKLHLNEYHTKMNVQLVELGAELLNLVEMTLHCTGYVSADSIIEFIETHEKLMRFEFSMVSYNKADFDTLRQHFRNDWHIQNTYRAWAGLTFSRKNSTDVE